MKLKITINQQVYEIDVEVAEPERQVPQFVATQSRGSAGPAVVAAPAGGRLPQDENRSCRSPLAGVVSEVKVAVGDEVTADQAVIVLEAMKMFTTITSPVAGVISAVDVEQGEAVKQGQLLLEVE